MVLGLKKGKEQMIFLDKKGTKIRASEFFAFWSFFKTIFTNRTLARHFMRIDQPVDVSGHNAEVCGSASWSGDAEQVPCQCRVRSH